MIKGRYNAATPTEALEIAFHDHRRWEPRHMAAIGNAIVSQTPVMRDGAVFYGRDDITGRSVLVREVGVRAYEVVVARCDAFEP